MTVIHSRVTTLRGELVTQHPLYGMLAYSLDYVEDDAVETACTDGIEIRYAPSFFQKLLDVEIKAVLAHEILHVALLHHTRRNSRDPKLWNIAADYVINLMLTKQGFKLPKDCLLEEKYKGLSTEQVYSKLRSTKSKEEIEKLAQKCPKLGDVKDCPKDKASQNEDEVKQMVEQSTILATARGEKLSDFQTIVESNRIHVGYADRIREYLKKAGETETSYDFLDEAYASQDIFLPGYDGEKGRLAILIDTSRSINPHYLKEFMGTVNALRDELNLKQTILIQCDSRVKEINEYYDGEPIKIKGGGGTAFQPALDAAEDFSPDVGVYLTDMLGEPPRPSSFPLLWVLWGYRPRSGFPGEIVEMELTS